MGKGEVFLSESVIEQHSKNKGVHIFVVVNHDEIDIGCQVCVQRGIFHSEFEFLFAEIVECACLGSQVPAVQYHGIISFE